MLYLTETDVRELLPMAAAVDLMEAAFRRLANKQSTNQPRRRLILPAGSVLHQMAAADGAYFGIKVYSTNARHGAHFHLLLYEAETGKPLALMEANHLGQIRTGAASGYATRLLAAPGASTLGVIGSGFQARTQVEAMAAVRKLTKVRVWSRSEEKRSRFAEECRRDLGLHVEAAATAEGAVRDASIVVTATNAKDPVLESEWVSGGAHVNAMGSNQARRREISEDLIRRAALVVVDSIEQSRLESGDLLMAFSEDDWRSPKLWELRAARTREGLPEDAVTIFKSNGLALEDVAAGAYVYEQARAANRGKPMP